MAWCLVDAHSRLFSDDIRELSSVDILELHRFFNGELLDFIFSKKELYFVVEH